MKSDVSEVFPEPELAQGLGNVLMVFAIHQACFDHQVGAHQLEIRHDSGFNKNIKNNFKGLI